MSTSPNATLKEVTGYINAGGRGTRIAPVLPAALSDTKQGVSKALLAIGEPKVTLVDRYIHDLLRKGVGSVVVAAGDHANVKRYVDEKYADQPAVQAITNMQQAGTGGDLLTAFREQPELYSDTILIGNVDTILDIDLARLVDQHAVSSATATIALTRNRGVPNQDAFYVGSDKKVIYSEEFTHQVIDQEQATLQATWRGSSTGAIALQTEFLHDVDWRVERGPLSIYRDVLGFALGQGVLQAYDNGNKFFIDVTTPETWQQVQSQPQMLQSYLKD